MATTIVIPYYIATSTHWARGANDGDVVIKQMQKRNGKWSAKHSSWDQPLHTQFGWAIKSPSKFLGSNAKCMKFLKKFLGVDDAGLELAAHGGDADELAKTKDEFATGGYYGGGMDEYDYENWIDHTADDLDGDEIITLYSQIFKFLGLTVRNEPVNSYIHVLVAAASGGDADHIVEEIKEYFN